MQAYLHDVALLRNYAEPIGVEPQDITEENLHTLFKQLNESGIAITTQCRIISGLRAFFRMMVIEDVIPDNPAEHITMPTRPKHLPDVLDDSEIEALQKTFDRSLPGPARNYVIVEVLYGCGLRVSELVNLKLSNIYADEQMLQIFGKGDKERWVPINPRALHLLQDYILTLRSQLTIVPGEEKYVFLNLRGRHLSRVAVFQFIKEAVEKAGEVGVEAFGHAVENGVAGGGDVLCGEFRARAVRDDVLDAALDAGDLADAGDLEDLGGLRGPGGDRALARGHEEAVRGGGCGGGLKEAGGARRLIVRQRLGGVEEVDEARLDLDSLPGGKALGKALGHGVKTERGKGGLALPDNGHYELQVG